MTAEPRPVEGAVYDDVYTELSLALGTDDTADEDVDFKRDLTARIMRHFATADRENAELRGEVERLRSLPFWAGRWVEMDLAARWKSERDDLRAQLAAAQAQLAEFAEQAYSAETALAAAEARLEAVREWAHGGHGGTVRPIDVWPKLAAALSAAPQPEPDVRAAYSESLRRLGRADLVPEPPADASWVTFEDARGRRTDIHGNTVPDGQVGEAARCAQCGRVLDPTGCCLGPATSTATEPPASDEPARCMHGSTGPHETSCFCPAGAPCVHDCPGPTCHGTGSATGGGR